MKRLLVLVLVLLATVALAETDPLLGLPLTGCTEDQILTVFEEKEFAPLLINKEGEYRGELCLGNESRELAVYVYDGNLKLIEVFWGIDSPSATQVEEITESRVNLVGLFTDYFEQEPATLSGGEEGWQVFSWDEPAMTLLLKSKEESEYAALAVEIRLNP